MSTDLKTQPPWWDGLTEKQRRFCEAYTESSGNATEAARKAGYKSPDPQGRENLRKPTIAKALEQLRQSQTSAAIANREERWTFWTTMMRDQASEPKDRIKASELLGKAQGDFIDRVEGKVLIVVEHVREGLPQ